MSYQDGWAAINLEMPARVPHTEYSLQGHWEVIKRSTGLVVTPDSPEQMKLEAAHALFKAWNFDFGWSTYLSNQPFGDLRTDMGHAEYQAGGIDWREARPCPFTTPEEVLAFDFYNAYGKIERAQWAAIFSEQYAENCRQVPDQVNMTGIYTTLVSGLLEIFGWEMLLLAAGTDQAAFGSTANRYADWMLQYFEALADSSAPVVMVHDDMVWTSGPIFSPRWYREFIFPNYRKLFAPLREAGKKIMFTSDGDYTKFIDDLAGCGINGFVMEPMTDMAYIAEKYGKTHVFIGNADTRILLNGSRDEIRAEVGRCMAIGKPYPGFFLAVGNHIPPNTPVENVMYYQELYEKMSKR
jgi:hypothetical protein